MAKELNAFTDTGATLYAVLLNSVGQAWNGSSWETVQSANWATYDIAMTEAAAGVYFADMPAVVAGLYSYVVYSQAGASPATTDALVGSGYIAWDGAKETGLVTAIADSIPADGSMPSANQALYMIWQFLTEKSVSSTTVTVNKADGSTGLMTFTLDSATAPTAITRAS